MYTACPATLHGWYLIYYLGSIYRTMKALAWDMMEGISDRCTYLAKRKYFHSGQNGKTNISIWQKANFSESKVSISTNWRKQTKPLFSGLKRWKTCLANHFRFRSFSKLYNNAGYSCELSSFVPESGDTSFHIQICSHIWIYLQKTSTPTF